LLTHRQTDKVCQKHNLLGGGNYYKVVQPLLYIIYHGFIYDVTLWRNFY